MKHTSPFARVLCGLLFGGTAAMAKTLYVGSGAGQIHSYSVANGAFTKISSTNDSFPAPTWQTIYGDYLYSVSESGGNEPGAITAYTIADGKFTKKSVATGLSGPVHIAIVGKGTGLITAAYGGAGINTFTASYGTVRRSQQFTYTTPDDASKTVPDRQDASHPHQVVVDPTGQFAVVPDLGADYLRVYLIKGSSSTFNLRHLYNVKSKKGSGPRHGVFWPNKSGTNPTHFYAVAELDNTITAYKLTYQFENVTFENPVVYNTFGDINTMPKEPVPAAGEIAISPDDKFFYVSNRLDRYFKGPPAQDAIAAWSINADGTLKFIELTPAGGQNPRHFSFVTIDGKDYVTVANPASDNVSMFTRDTATGKLGQKPYASMNVTGAACAQWK